jgi:hypothetical protein
MADPVIAEFATPEGVIAAARRVRELGYIDLEAYTPFPLPELEEALAIRRSKLPWLVFAAGATGAALAYLVLWWTNAVDYPLNVGGRSTNSIPTHIPIMFELMVLFAGGTAFLAALVLSGLPRLHHRVFELEGFDRTTVDRFWLTVGDTRGSGADVAADELAILRGELVMLGAVAIRGMAP